MKAVGSKQNYLKLYDFDLAEKLLCAVAIDLILIQEQKTNSCGALTGQNTINTSGVFGTKILMINTVVLTVALISGVSLFLLLRDNSAKR